MEKTNSRRIISDNSLNALTSSIESQFSAKGGSVNVVALPSLQSIFPAINEDDPNQTPDVLPYPPSATVPQPNDLVFYVHSSGSTGFPKPIPQTQKTLLQWSQIRKSPGHRRPV